MNSPRLLAAGLLCILASSANVVSGQEFGPRDRNFPGDAMIQEYLETEAKRIEADFMGEVKTAEDWEKLRPKLTGEYLHMLGLSPMPERTPLQATITRTLNRGDYFVDMLHYQSRPGLYVTANLYRPARVREGEKLPAVLYVCGHSGRGRNGNKTAFQSHGAWLARHGYVCLMVDTLQLGEIAGIHHGTYREGRWWWLSRGYTPAGVECWNGVRGIDYLVSRADVDTERIAVTGISGGGAATFWIAAVDERVKIAAPVSGMADLESYIGNRLINGHCDCMFLYNTYQWNWTRIAGLVAPRPMLFVNSDNDPIFPMDANERVINRLERLYSLFGAGDRVDALVSIGGHDYRKDIRQGVFRFLNTHLKGDPRAVTDTEVDLVVEGREARHPIPPEDLRVFAKDEDIPKDALNGKIDESFVEIARPRTPTKENFEEWRNGLVRKLRDVTFHHFPEKVPAATAVREEGHFSWLRTERNIEVRLLKPRRELEESKWVVLEVANDELDGGDVEALFKTVVPTAGYKLEPRGTGATRWTKTSPPNYVERSHYLLGRTVDSGRVWDIIAAARYLQAQHPDRQVMVAGNGRAGVLCVYAAVLEEEIRGLTLGRMPESLMDKNAPTLLNALRVCDVPEAMVLARRDVLRPGVGYTLPKRTVEIFNALNDPVPSRRFP